MNVVLFDIDHTIMSSPEGANAKASEVMFKQVFNIETSEDAVEKVGKTEWGLIEEVLVAHGQNLADESTHRIPDEAYMVWAEAFKKEIEGKNSTLLPGIWELVNELAQMKEIKLGILSGNSVWRSEAKLASVGLDEFFKDRMGKLVGVFGNEARTREGLLARATDRLVFDNDCLTIIDDSLIGAQMLSNLKIYSIFVATGSATVEDLKKFQERVYPDFGEERWREVLQYIQSCPIIKNHSLN
jgi:beta-phosphoglucomutase-like phosphatase (HAD superfamily)